MGYNEIILFILTIISAHLFQETVNLKLGNSKWLMYLRKMLKSQINSTEFIWYNNLNKFHPTALKLKWLCLPNKMFENNKVFNFTTMKFNTFKSTLSLILFEDKTHHMLVTLPKTLFICRVVKNLRNHTEYYRFDSTHQKKLQFSVPHSY